MKQISNSSGFTLMEILVALNISSISILLVVSFLLFALKYLNTIKKKYEKSYDYNSFYFSLNKTLRNVSSIDFAVSGTTSCIITAERDTITFDQNEIVLKRLFKLNNLEHIAVEIKGGDKTLAIYKDGDVTIDGVKYTNHLSTFKFDKIIITTTKDSSNYTFKYMVPAISGNKFIDIKNEAI